MTAVTFRPLRPADLPLLAEWIARPHVRFWWNAPATPEDVEAEYGAVARGEDTARAFMALAEGREIGFFQSYVVQGAGGGWWPAETDPGARGIDFFLASGDDLGCGLGSAMVRAGVEELLRDPAVSQVQADPSPGNARAIRCLRRAGFQAVRQVLTPDGDALLMVRRRGDAS